jgi:hypothetical protein
MTGFGKFLVIIVGLIMLLPGLCGAAGLLTLANYVIGDIYRGLRAGYMLGFDFNVSLMVGVPSLIGLAIGWTGIKVLKTAFRKPAVSNDTPARQWTAEPPTWPSEPPNEK